MTHLTPTPQHLTIVLVDVAGFTDPARQTTDRLAVRQGMYEVLKTAFTESDVDFDSCPHEDRGDGALILIPSTVSKATIADRLPDRIVAALRRYNSTRIPQAQFKLRVALNSGDVLHDGNGWVGTPVDTTFRILDAPVAKTALAESDRMVALICSDHFYTEVIAHDPGTFPESYHQIPVAVKTFSSLAWLRLLGDGAAAPPSQGAALAPVGGPEAAPDEAHPVHDVIPAEDLAVLRGFLPTEDLPRLSVIINRAVGQAIPLPRRDDVHDAWAAVRYLAEFNAGPDGVPPAVLFLEQLAGEIGGEAGAAIADWVREQTRRLRLGRAIEEHRLAREPVPAEPHLYLTIMIERDAIDPARCVLAWWRQDDPLAWPPPLGGVREVGFDELEHRVDEVILDAEATWSEQGISAAVEFLLPRTLLDLPVHQWRKEHESGRPRLLRYDYRISLRSLERMRARHWRRAWHLRWASMLENPSAARLHSPGSAEFEEHPIDAVLSDPHWVGLAMAKPPSPHPDPASSDELFAALRGGLPVLLWHPGADPGDLRELIDWLLGGDGGFLDLPARRKSANIPKNGLDESLVGGLVMMWDDPERVIVLDQPSTPSRP